MHTGSPVVESPVLEALTCPVESSAVVPVVGSGPVVAVVVDVPPLVFDVVAAFPVVGTSSVVVPSVVGVDVDSAPVEPCVSVPVDDTAESSPHAVSPGANRAIP